MLIFDLICRYSHLKYLGHFFFFFKFNFTPLTGGAIKCVTVVFVVFVLQNAWIISMVGWTIIPLIGHFNQSWRPSGVSLLSLPLPPLPHCIWDTFFSFFFVLNVFSNMVSMSFYLTFCEVFSGGFPMVYYVDLFQCDIYLLYICFYFCINGGLGVSLLLLSA